MYTVVLDGDPTGTQSVSGLRVLLRWNANSIVAALISDGAVYLQTNSRAIPEGEAVELASLIKYQLAEVESRVGSPILVVLRGDSTLRGHVFAESDVFAGDDGRILFVPAFPAGGRTTVGSVHYVRIGGADLPAAETELARDPVFGYRQSQLIEWVRETGNRRAVAVPLENVRASGGAAVADALRCAGPGEAIVPDAEIDDDILPIHAGLRTVLQASTHVVVRSGALLAAICAGHPRDGLIARPVDVPEDDGLLVVCGSHTAASTGQLQRLTEVLGIPPIEIATDLARADPEKAGSAAAVQAAHYLREHRVAVLITERHRRAEHGTLADGEVVMTATRILAKQAGVIVSQGGITAAEVARTGLGASHVYVRGQIEPGISVWDMTLEGRSRMQIVVPGNVGEAETLVDVLSSLEQTTMEDM
ncbi:four-carbon acid sugar kinase family protein [Glaciibacter superstes]|uniref:four-carbon acid sugar kinase family protein n=1 Tax=Glaciibacter superstes TaxID=501023 RepID=UPI0003B55681|nr:four-carbon acid sugar kinase family protein [Glaciibacter superstes]